VVRKAPRWDSKGFADVPDREPANPGPARGSPTPGTLFIGVVRKAPRWDSKGFADVPDREPANPGPARGSPTPGTLFIGVVLGWDCGVIL